MRKFYLYVGHRRVHYRRAGYGPPLVILPAVPQSSAMVEPLITALADRFTVFALDAPGYGESAALALESPTVQDYAGALAETLDALQLPRVDLYAVDTSAPVAAEFARRGPNRARRLVLDRPPLASQDELSELLARCCPPIVPDDEGSHLVKAWGRLRDLYSFRPWYRRAIDARIRRDLPAPLELYHEFVDLLRGGLNYWRGPHAAWRYDLAAALRQIGAPITVLETAAGVVRAKTRLGSTMPNLTFAELRDPDAADAQAQIAARVQEVLSGDPLPAAPPPPKVSVVPGAVRRDYAESRLGQLPIYRVASGRPDGGGRPLVLSNGSLLSGANNEESLVAWAVDRPVVSFDTPGVGDSPAVPGTPEMDEIAAVLIDGMDALGLDDVDLYGGHTSAMTAIEIAIARPDQVKHAILNGVTMFTDEHLAEKLPRYFLPLRVSDDGGFLAWSWHYLRDMWLWYPWYDHRGDHFRPDATINDAVRQHARVADFLKGGLTYVSPYRAAVAFPSRVRLPLMKVPTLLCAAPDDTLRPALPEAASLLPHAITVITPGRGSPEARAASDALFRQFFADEPLVGGQPI